MVRAIFIALGLLALSGPAFGQCEGNAPYWAQNEVSPPPPFFGLVMLPGVVAITAMSLNAKEYVYNMPRVTHHQMREGEPVETHPGCMALWIVSRQPTVIHHD